MTSRPATPRARRMMTGASILPNCLRRRLGLRPMYIPYDVDGRDRFAEAEQALLGWRWTRPEADALITLIEEGALVGPSR